MVKREGNPGLGDKAVVIRCGVALLAVEAVVTGMNIRFRVAGVASCSRLTVLIIGMTVSAGNVAVAAYQVKIGAFVGIGIERNLSNLGLAPLVFRVALVTLRRWNQPPVQVCLSSYFQRNIYVTCQAAIIVNPTPGAMTQEAVIFKIGVG